LRNSLINLFLSGKGGSASNRKYPTCREGEPTGKGLTMTKNHLSNLGEYINIFLSEHSITGGEVSEGNC
jgi:hypothetical protein